MQPIYFNTDREVSEAGLLRMMCCMVPATTFEWVDDLYELRETDEDTIYVEKHSGGGQFFMYYIVQSYHRVETSGLRWMVDLLKRLARTEHVNILMTEEGLNPYLFIHIDPEGHAATVGVVTEPYDARDELTIDDYYNDAFGAFALESAITDGEMEVLNNLVRPIVPVFELAYAPGEVTSFSQYKDNFFRLKRFVHHYFVMPIGKQEWLSKDEKAELFSALMIVFGEKRKVCFFPPNATVVENIPGGSDSESFCICLDGEQPTKLIYKPRRQSWLTNK